jgi:tryptophan-rich sensory protein
LRESARSGLSRPLCSPVLRRIVGGLGVIVTMLAAIGFAGNVDRPEAAALLPLAGWLGFAGVLNGETLRRNG